MSMSPPIFKHRDLNRKDRKYKCFRISHFEMVMNQSRLETQGS